MTYVNVVRFHTQDLSLSCLGKDCLKMCTIIGGASRLATLPGLCLWYSADATESVVA